MATKDDRTSGSQKPIAKIQLDQFVWANGETANVTITLRNVSMLVERIVVIVDDSAANKTNTFVSVKDEDGATIINSTDITNSFTAMANGLTNALSTRASADFDAVPVMNDITIIMSISGDPLAAHTADVILYGP